MSILLKPPFTRKQLDAMHAKDYDYCWKTFRVDVERALNPPPPSPPPPDVGARTAAMTDILKEEYSAWRKKQGFTQPGDSIEGQRIESLRFEVFMKEKREALALSELEKVIDAWLIARPEFVISEANRSTVWGYISEQLDGKVTHENLEKAFVATKGDLVLDESKSIDPDRPETRAVVVTNGVFRPYDPEASQNTMKRHLVGQSTPGAFLEDAIIRNRPERMTAVEFAEACRTSATFGNKMTE